MNGPRARARQAVGVDAPITLDELLDRVARETLEAGGNDLGVEVWVFGPEGETLVGGPAPEEIMEARPEYEVLVMVVDERRYVVSGLMHEGDHLGVVAVGPFPPKSDESAARRLAAHIGRLTDAFVTEGMRRALSARMHTASLEEVNREMTEKNRSLAQAVDRLQEADRIKSNFLATVSHELRTPLTSVIGYSEMLLENIAGPLNDEQREYVTTVMEKADQLLQLITGILDISRIEAGALQIERHPVDLSEVVSVALSTIAPQARRKRLQVSCELPDDLPVVLGDRDKLRQVLLNLLGNACKFTPEGGLVSIKMTIGTVVADDPTSAPAVRIAVSDSGIGIPTEHHDRIFDPFYQVDSSSTREYGGTGLGLSIVKRFVEAHGGRVVLDSAAGRGTTFLFTLPLAEAAPGSSARPPT